MYKPTLTYIAAPKQAWTERVDTPRQLERHRDYVIGRQTTFVQKIQVMDYLARDMTLDSDSLKKEKKNNCNIL